MGNLASIRVYVGEPKIGQLRMQNGNVLDARQTLLIATNFFGAATNLFFDAPATNFFVYRDLLTRRATARATSTIDFQKLKIFFNSYICL
jgi:hypothetical protein